MENTARLQVREWLAAQGRKSRWLAASLNANSSSVSLWLTGARIPGPDARERLARFTGLPVGALSAWADGSAPTCRTALYRHFDGEGSLLYVGISAEPLSCQGSHGAKSEWFDQVCSISIEWFSSRDLAKDAESFAVRNEQPRHNKDCCAQRDKRLVHSKPSESQNQGSVSLGRYIKRHGLSQRDLAAMLGVSDAAVSRMMRGHHNPSLATALAIAKVTRGEVPADCWTQPKERTDA